MANLSDSDFRYCDMAPMSCGIPFVVGVTHSNLVMMHTMDKKMLLGGNANEWMCVAPLIRNDMSDEEYATACVQNLLSSKFYRIFNDVPYAAEVSEIPWYDFDGDGDNISRIETIVPYRWDGARSVYCNVSDVFDAEGFVVMAVLNSVSECNMGLPIVRIYVGQDVDYRYAVSLNTNIPTSKFDYYVGPHSGMTTLSRLRLSRSDAAKIYLGVAEFFYG